MACISVVAEECSEAAIVGEAVVKAESTIYLKHRTTRLYGCYATDRSLAALLSDYRLLAVFSSSAWRNTSTMRNRGPRAWLSSTISRT